MKDLLHRISQTKFALLIVMALASSSMLGGCAGTGELLTKVIGGVTDAMVIVDRIESFVDDYFATFPNPENQAVAQRAIDVTRASLNTALRSAQGSQHLSQEDVDAAFEDFAVAYASLLRTLGEFGVKLQTGDPGKLQAAPGVLLVPEPMVLAADARAGS